MQLIHSCATLSTAAVVHHKTPCRCGWILDLSSPWEAGPPPSPDVDPDLPVREPRHVFEVLLLPALHLELGLGRAPEEGRDPLAGGAVAGKLMTSTHRQQKEQRHEHGQGGMITHAVRVRGR